MKRWNLSKNKLLLVDEEFLGIVPSDHGSINVNIKDSGVFRIPIPYIKKIEIEDLSHKMTVFFREESYEEIQIGDEKVKREIVEYLKGQPSAFGGYEFRKEKLFSLLKRPMLAGVILSVVFLVAYFLAFNIEAGKAVTAPVFVLAIAGLGSSKLFGIFSVIMIVIATRIILQVRNNQQKHIFKKRQSHNAIGDFLRERK